MRIQKSALLFIVVSGILAGLIGCVPNSEKAQGEKGVTEFHDKFNQSAFVEIYERADVSLRQIISRDEFVEGLNAIRQGHGTVQNTQLLAADYNYSSGTRMIKLLHRTHFEKGDAQEQFIFFIDGNGPRLKSYVFR